MNSLRLAVLFISLPCFAQSPATLVDPFIGTGPQRGRTFPGAVRPWGMVSVSPHTAPGSPSGYVWGAPTFHGFGHVHLSGTGCSDLGNVLLTATRGEFPSDPSNVQCRYRNETARPGYYGVDLVEPGLHAEVTATPRCGLTKFTAQSAGVINVMFNAGKSLAIEGGGSVRVVSQNEIEGSSVSGGFCGESNRQTVYFVAQFSKSAIDAGVWNHRGTAAGLSISGEDQSLGAWLRFNLIEREELLVRVGISYVSTANARLNLEWEIPHWDFSRIRDESFSQWDSVLSRVSIDDDDHNDKNDNLKKFYSALYHTMIHPNIISDVNGEFPRMGRTGIGKYTGRDRYTVFSLWDTYRTLHPLLTLLYPERASAMVQTMIDMYRESGWLPKWELAGNETYMMVGDPVVPVIVDTYLKGVRDFDIDIAYEAMKKHADESAKQSGPIRPGYHDQLRYGYIPFEQDTTDAWWVWGPVSNTLEYAFADWTFSRLAETLGKTEDAREFQRRSMFYRNVFDTATLFMRPRLRGGQWLAPFNPLATEGSGSWAGSGGPGYVEGNAWNYTWFVPHDVPGLIALFGGEKPFMGKLQECFDGGHFTIGNEPDIAFPYLFTMIPGGRQRTVTNVDKIMRTEFGTGPNGLPGDDDAGAISAWYVFSALGIYQAAPAAGSYQLGRPLFKSIRVHLNRAYYPAELLTIKQINADGSSRVTFNGTELNPNEINHGLLIRGGDLIFEERREN